MAWLESHQTLADHPKTRKLSRILGTSKPTTIGHLHCLWWWALDYADDGDLSRYDELDIAIGAEWDDDPARLVEALIAAGFLDRDGNTLRIHDWDDYAGKLIDRRRQNAQRMRQKRAMHDTSSNEEQSDTCNARASHVPPTPHARAGLPNQTKPNTTKPVGDTPTPPRRAKAPNYSTEFEAFWRAYPKGHGSKKETWEQWERLVTDDATREAVMVSLDAWKQSDRWQRGYVRDAQRWLKHRQWEDDPPMDETRSGSLRVLNGRHDDNLADEELEAIARGIA